jgi:hypothetical protein
MIMRILFVLLALIGMAGAREPIRERGLSLHLLPDRVAKVRGGHGGFTVTDPATRKPGKTFSTPEEVLTHFEAMPESIKEHGIWIVLTNPVSYSEPEMQKLGILVDSCKKKQIPLFTCRAADLPNGWTRK